jgi:hypothetical protein
MLLNVRRNYRMRVSTVLMFLLLTLAACSSRQPNDLSQDSLQIPDGKDTSQYIRHNAAMARDYLNKKTPSKNGSYFLLTQLSDSTAKINWGNDTLKREYEEPLDFMFVNRLSVKWENGDYLILDYFTGTNAWTNVALPLNKREQVQEFGNGLCFDEKDSYLVTQEVGDTIMAVHNLKTRQEQFIVEKQRPCESVMNYACLDTINIRDKVLYYKWVTPRTDITPNSKVEKRVRLKI